MVLLETEGVDSFGLPWGASLSDNVDALPSILAGYTWFFSLFSVSFFLVSNSVTSLEIATKWSTPKDIPEERIAGEPVKL